MKRADLFAVAAAAAFGMGATCPKQEAQAMSDRILEHRRASAHRDLVGCYQFERNATSKELGLPWGFELEDAPLGPGWPLMSGRGDVRRASTATSATAREDHPFGYWVGVGLAIQEIGPGQSRYIEIGHPGGGGFVVQLEVTGQDLIGSAVARGDAVPLGGAMGPRAPAPVVARRVLCGAS